MASTTLSVGNAIGLAVLIAVANGHAASLGGPMNPVAVAEGIKLAFWLAAVGTVASLALTFALPGKAHASMQ